MALGVPPPLGVPYGVQKHLLHTSLITKDQYEGLSAIDKADFANTDREDVLAALVVLKERFKVDFAGTGYRAPFRRRDARTGCVVARSVGWRKHSTRTAR